VIHQRLNPCLKGGFLFYFGGFFPFGCFFVIVLYLGLRCCKFVLVVWFVSFNRLLLLFCCVGGCCGFMHSPSGV